jgi:hypothetical protein
VLKKTLNKYGVHFVSLLSVVESLPTSFFSLFSRALNTCVYFVVVVVVVILVCVCY